MSLAVRAADLETDRQLLIEVCRRYLTPLSDAHRFDWLYRQSPHGTALAWVITDGAETVGACAAFPRHISVDGNEATAYLLGDFCVSPAHRSLGPALLLQRACLEGIARDPKAALWYDFPSAAMRVIYQRLGLEPWGEMVRFAKPLRTDRKIREWVKVPVFASGVSATANFWLRWRDWRPAVVAPYETEQREGPCTEEFSVLARSCNAPRNICIRRTADYLNWRYLRHPQRRHEIVTLRQEGKLRGYAFFAQRELDAWLVDLFAGGKDDVMVALVRDVIARLSGRGVMTLSVPLSTSHPWIPSFLKLGFRPRESCPIMMQVLERGTGRPRVEGDFDWHLMQGDRDD